MTLMICKLEIFDFKRTKVNLISETRQLKGLQDDDVKDVYAGKLIFGLSIGFQIIIAVNAQNARIGEEGRRVCRKQRGEKRTGIYILFIKDIIKYHLDASYIRRSFVFIFRQ